MLEELKKIKNCKFVINFIFNIFNQIKLFVQYVFWDSICIKCFYVVVYIMYIKIIKEIISNIREC